MKKKTRLASLVVAVLLALTACSTGTRSTQSTSSASDQAVAALHGTITFGTEGTYSPFTYHDKTTNELTGYDIDVAKAVGQKLGVKVAFAETQWDGIFAALEAKRFDGVANEVELTDARKAQYDLSNPYSVSYPVIITKAGDTSIKSVADVKGKTAAQTEGSNWNQTASSYGATVETVSGFAESVVAVKQGRAQLTVNDALAALDYFKTTNDSGASVAVQVTDDKVYQGFAFRKNSGLLPAVNNALASLEADGTLAQIGQKYFGKDISK